MKTNTGKEVLKMYSNSGSEINKMYNNAGSTIYNGASAPLRHIKVGDDLSGKTLYFTYPSSYFGAYPGGDEYDYKKVISCGANNYFGYIDTWENPNMSWMQSLDILQNNTSIIEIMHIDRWGLWDDSAIYEYTMPSDFGVVTSIMTNYAMYDYIWVEETLQNITVGDDLSGVTLYCSFPDNLYNTAMFKSFTNVITGTGTNNRIVEDGTLWARGMWARCHIFSDWGYIYNYEYSWETEPPITIFENNSMVTCPSEFGVVTAINTDTASYQYIKIYK